ncbi:WRKY domain-containing protein [Cephalotus follicularis]|uniref:WRKY domain-containing protein n=1 Tax=Cephalotus follicularis TaxID=3775 RepID=A0A1Q3B880_CEPFO|nr:WRKY domain-containing protein [Cephalotus follicularis]
MENYQMFFPCSSTGQFSKNPILTEMTSSHVFNNFHGDTSNGFSGLIDTENLVSKSEAKDPLTQSGSVVKPENEVKPAKEKRDNKKIKKPRFAFQTRSQVDILDDGYRWRKYGQKAVKNNKFPRSYYRCTHQGCNVKKQVQRLTKDEGVVVTTYEGVHTHPIEKQSENFEHILSQMRIYAPF